MADSTTRSPPVEAGALRAVLREAEVRIPAMFAELHRKLAEPTELRNAVRALDARFGRPSVNDAR
jgi:hypothetical protein